MRPVCFLGDSLKRIRAFPPAVRSDVGFQIETLQSGGQPTDFKPMPSIAVGVEEIRVRSSDGAYRVIYAAHLAAEIIVLHAFRKKSRSTSKMDIQIARTRFNQLKRQLP